MTKKALFMVLSISVFFCTSIPEQAHADFTASAPQHVEAGLSLMAAGTYVNVADYGARADGNGTHNDLAATDNRIPFQNAIAAALRDHKDLYIPGGSGYYRTSSGLEINVDYDRGITVFGDWKDVSRIHIDTDNSVHGLLITGPAGRAPINIRNLAIKKTKSVFDESKLLFILNSRDFACSGLDVCGSTGMSFVVANSVNGVIENNFVHDTVHPVDKSGCDGIHVTDEPGGNCSNFEIRNNTVMNVWDDGIAAGCHYDGTVSNIRIYENTIQYTIGSGIKVHEGARDVEVYSNTILDTELGGIAVEAVHFGARNIQDIRIHHNTIVRPCRCDCGYWGGIAVVDRESHVCEISGFEINNNHIEDYSNRYGILVGEYIETLRGLKCMNKVRNGYVWANTIIGKAGNRIAILCAENVSLHPPILPPTDMSVNIQAANGQFVVAEEGGGGIVNANRNQAGSWETFLLTDKNGGDLRDGDEVTFRCNNRSYYLQALNGGCGYCPLVACGGGPGDWETFVIIDVDHPGDVLHSGDRVALMTCNEYYACAELGGGSIVMANRTAIGPWEIFSLSIW